MAKSKQKSKIQSWWSVTGDPYELARQVFDTVMYIEEDQQERKEKNLRCLRLYGNVNVAGIGPYTHSRSETPNLPENRVKYSVATACTDTLSAKISKMKPKVSFLTSNGNFSVQDRAKKLTQWVTGAFKQNEIYEKHQALFRDGLICDVGALKHYAHAGRIYTERCLSSEIYVDFADGMYGTPTHLYHVKFVHKDTLIAAYPKSAAAIKQSASTLDTTAVKNMSALSEEEKDYVVVIEGWHLPSSEDSHDGRHVIAVEKGVLIDEVYKRNYFPFTFFKWSKPVIGFYGQSLVDRLTGNQIEINKMLRVIQRSFHLGSSFKVFLEYGSRIAKEHISNEIGSLVYYSGQKPEYYVPKVVHEEYFRHLEWLIRSSFEESGISQLSATSRLPTGLDTGSGKALREYNDLETERFAITAQQYESSFLETARIYIDLACEMDELGEDMVVVAESRRFVQSIKWSEVKLQDNPYVMQMWPTSSLPQTPAGKLAYVQELINGGFIDKLWALQLLEFPDTDGYTSLQLAPLDDLMYTLDSLLYKGKYLPPEPFQDLSMGIQLFQQAYLRARIDGAPDDRLELIRRWMAAADAMVSKAKAASQPQAPIGANPVMAGGAGSPMPPPPGQPPMMPGPQAMPPAAPQMAA